MLRASGFEGRKSPVKSERMVTFPLLSLITREIPKLDGIKVLLPETLHTKPQTYTGKKTKKSGFEDLASRRTTSQETCSSLCLFFVFWVQGTGC